MRRALAMWLALAATSAVACGLDLSGLDTTTDAGFDAAALDGPAYPEDAQDDVYDSTAPDAASDAGADVVHEAGADAPEASADAPPPPPDAGCGVICNGSCSGSTDCSGCAGATLLCAATKSCSTDCSDCAGNPIECYACDPSGQNPLGTCQPAGGTAYCLSGDYSSAYDGGPGTHCTCDESADCPGATQVCIAVGTAAPFECYTCGEQFTQTFQCQNGDKCNEPNAQCH